MKNARITVLVLALWAGSSSLAFGQDTSSEGTSVRILRDERRDDRRLVVLTDDLFYCYPPTNELIIVPAYFESDFASIPPMVRGMINPFGDHAEAAIVHDWLYAVGERGQRLKADQIFRYAMMERGVDVATRNLMYQAVRAGGGEAYGRSTEWRFIDPATRQPVSQPPARPSAAAVGTTDCATFDQDIARLRAQYASVYMPRSRPNR